MHYYWKTECLAELGEGFLSALPELYATCPMPLGDVGVLQLGGRSTSATRTTGPSATGTRATSSA